MRKSNGESRGNSFELGLPSEIRTRIGKTQVKGKARRRRLGDMIRLCCHRGARGMGGKTTKTNCEFRLKLRHMGLGYTVMEKSILEHNHDLLPIENESLPDDGHSHAKLLAEIGAPRPVIITFVQRGTGRIITRRELGALFKPDFSSFTHARDGGVNI
jgi:hypothetical protein